MAEELEDRVIEFTNKILELGGWDLEAELQGSTPGAADGDGDADGAGEDDADQKLTVQVRGQDVSLLLGRNAELLDALEYLSNRVFAREAGKEGRIVFDSGSYRVRREKELQLMAAKAAERVRTTRAPFTFDPMSPNERRIIHTALLDDTGIRTESKGDGVDRKVVIYPA